ncbi:MAG: DUF4242 domain-containing protein [Methylococcaceae bacterium]|nr:DUF4242 domain-containing protein [Methylococcaceae bacterium]
MPKFLIEREMEGAGSLTDGQLQAMAEKARAVVADPAANVQWLYSFVAEDRTYCVYIAPDEEVLREQSELAGFPTTRVSRVLKVIDPTTAE